MKFRKLEPVEFAFLGYDDPKDEVTKEQSYDLLRKYLEKGIPDLIVIDIKRSSAKIVTRHEGENCRLYTVNGYKTNNPVVG